MTGFCEEVENNEHNLRKNKFALILMSMLPIDTTSTTKFFFLLAIVKKSTDRADAESSESKAGSQEKLLE